MCDVSASRPVLKGVRMRHVLSYEAVATYCPVLLQQKLVIGMWCGFNDCLRAKVLWFARPSRCFWINIPTSLISLGFRLSESRGSFLISSSTSDPTFVFGLRFSKSISLQSILPEDLLNSRQMPGGKYRRKKRESRISRPCGLGAQALVWGSGLKGVL